MKNIFKLITLNLIIANLFTSITQPACAPASKASAAAEEKNKESKEKQEDATQVQAPSNAQGNPLPRNLARAQQRLTPALMMQNIARYKAAEELKKERAVIAKQEIAEKSEIEHKVAAYNRTQTPLDRASTNSAETEIPFDPLLPYFPVELQELIRQYLIDLFDFLPIYLQGQVLLTPKEHTLPFSIAMNDNGTIIAYGKHTPLIKIWDQNGKLIQEGNGASNPDRVEAITLDNNNNIILRYNKRNPDYTCEYNTKILKQDGSLLKTLPVNATDDDYPVTCHNDTVITGSHDGTIKIWNYEGECTDTLQSPYNHPISSITISPDGKTIVAGSQHRYSIPPIHIWKEKQYVKSLNYEAGLDDCNYVAISRDGQTIAASDYYRIRIYDIDGNKKSQLEIPSACLNNLDVRSLGYLQNTLLAAGYSNHIIRFWRLNGTVAATLKLRNYRSRRPIKPNSYVIIGKDNTMVTTTTEGEVKLWKPNEKLMYDLTLQQLDCIKQLIEYIEKNAYSAELAIQPINFSSEQIAQFKQLPPAAQACLQDFYQIKIEQSSIEQKSPARQ